MLDAKHEFEVDMERQSWPPSPPRTVGADRSPGPARRTAEPDDRDAAGRAAASPGCAGRRGASAGRRDAAAARPQPGRGHPDAASLADLRDRGAISAEEYEARRRTCSGGSEPGVPVDAGRRPRPDARPVPLCGPRQRSAVPDRVPIVIVVAIMLLVGFPVHEFAHAFAAYRLGDGTAKLFGRLTLNPIAHFDPIGGILLAISFIASAGRSGSAGRSRRRSTR